MDGTVMKHNGYKIDGQDKLLSGAKEYLAEIPGEDKVVIITSRTEEYGEMTINFLDDNEIRYDEMLINVPVGERILVNDMNPQDWIWL